MSNIQLSKLAAVEKYRPRFRLHPKEGYYPVEIDYALSACELWTSNKSNDKIKDTLLLAKGGVNQTSLVQASSNIKNPMDLSINYSTWLKLVDKTLIGGQRDVLDDIPIYAIVNEINYVDARGIKSVYWDIVYYTQYLYNGAITISSTEGVHSWDHETVIVRINPTVKASPSGSSYIYLSQHDSGVWMKSRDMQWDESHPIVYVAKNSHAHYPKAKYWPRLFGFAGDKTSDRGDYWKPPVRYIDMSTVRGGNVLWTHFNGKATKTGQAFPHFRPWATRTVTNDLYRKGTYDTIAHKLGDKKKNQYAIALIIVGVIILIISIMFGVINFWAILIITPVIQIINIGTNMYLGG